MYVVMIATAGNQRYIFSSGKRQENVGASDLIARVSGAWADEALGEVFKEFDPESWRIPTHEAELLMAGAGQVIALVKKKEAGRALVTELTERALERAPGLDVRGVVVPKRGSLAETVNAARGELAAIRNRVPGAQARFLRLPFAADCESTGLPAAGMRREAEGEPERPRSAASLVKLDHFRTALERLGKDAWPDEEPETSAGLMKQIVHDLSFEADWVAVVHADGNGMGKIFGALRRKPGSVEETEGGEDRPCEGDELRKEDEFYREQVRIASKAVDDCTRHAFRTALKLTAAEQEEKDLYTGHLPVVPLVLGGDDLTVICTGRVALRFARNYLEAFELATADDERLAELRRRADLTCLTAAAGVAIVKRNYPFRFAYDLAEDLVKEAKTVKELGSALAFTVLYESSAPDLRRIRASAALSGAVPSCTPYLLGEHETGVGRRWCDLERRVAALDAKDEEGKPLLPRAAVQDLREGLGLGAEVAQARFALLRHRYAEDAKRRDALAALAGERGLIWADDLREDGNRQVTGLMDAIMAQPFLPRRDRKGERG